MVQNEKRDLFKPDLFKSDAKQGQKCHKGQNQTCSKFATLSPLCASHPSGTSGWPLWAATSLGLPPFRHPPSPLSSWTPFFGGDKLTRCQREGKYSSGHGNDIRLIFIVDGANVIKTASTILDETWPSKTCPHLVGRESPRTVHKSLKTSALGRRSGYHDTL